MIIVILGCGVVGAQAGAILAAGGHAVLGVRRRAFSHGREPFTLMSGDASDPSLYVALAAAYPRIDAVLLTANPGLRRGRDNGLAAAVGLVHRQVPGCRLVYTGTTAVYGDAGAGGVDEHGPLRAGDPAVRGLLAIEAAVAAHASSLVLRAPALVGPTRTHALERLREAARQGSPCQVPGDLDRPFSYLHERDLAELCALAALGALGDGVLNAAAPERLTAGDYYRQIARRGGVECPLVGDHAPLPRRWIDAGRLHRLLPGRRWRGIDDG
jgi:nucleoside-diphosphate-sugar epimerase